MTTDLQETVARLRALLERANKSRPERTCPQGPLEYGLVLADWADVVNTARLEIVSALPTLLTALEAQRVVEGYVPVRADVVALLKGEAPLDGVWFQEVPYPPRPSFWWREYLSAAALSTPQPDERLREELAEYRRRDMKQRDRIHKLTGAVHANPPIALDAGSWFYPEGDTSSEECRDSPEEVIDYAVEGMEKGEKRVVIIERAIHLPEVFAAVHVFTEDEKDERGSDDDHAHTLHATLEEARAALEASAPQENGE